LLFFLAFFDWVLVDWSLDADWSLELEPVAVSLALDFCPEFVAAGVWVAFSCSRPDALMFEVALSSPVAFEPDAVELSALLPLVEPFEEDDVLGMPLEDEPLVAALSLEEAPVVALPLVDALPFIEELLPIEEPVPAAVSDEDDGVAPDFDDVPLL
jgi:hypothetical protein